MKLLYVVTQPFCATKSGTPDGSQIFRPNESVWWDEEQLCDPVVFHADLVQFEAKRAELSKSIEPFAVR
jgi:hypothetical protein